MEYILVSKHAVSLLSIRNKRRKGDLEGVP